jgi:hypothetical protein
MNGVPASRVYQELRRVCGASGAADYWIGVVAPIAILSVGMALVVAPLTTAVMVSAPDSLSGAASGVNNAASRLAGCSR